MDKIKTSKKSMILKIIICLFLFVLIGSMIRNIGKIKQDMNSKLEILNINIRENKLRIDSTRYTIADAWLSMQGNGTRTNIEKFYDDNVDFAMCPKEQIDVRILQNWYDAPIEPFRVLVMEYTKGYTVVYKDGTVKCYPRLIEEMNPDNISCDDLCQWEE